MKQKALLVDGHNFLFRGYHGVPITATRSDGTPINAVYGFFSLIRNTLKEIDCDYLVIFFDSETSIDKKKLSRPEYKANRPLEQGSIYQQLPLIKNILDILKITWIENKKIEADDLIGTYAKMFNDVNIRSYIASSDHDFMQLVSKDLLIVRGRHGNIDIYDTHRVFNDFGVLPRQYVDYLALVGDPTDNIKGIQGIGKKRASELLSDHRDIKSMYRHLDLLSVNLQKLLNGHENFLFNQKEFLKIKKDLKFRTKFKIKDHCFNKDVLPDKMGKFMNDNWDRIM